jgi:DNA-binding PadR family transcriptional regulator
MPAESSVRRSPLALTVLWMLAGGPLHPYAIQSRMKAWGKEQVVNLGQRANLYKAIERLRDAGLIAVRQTERDQRFPERTVYELTDAGRRQASIWLGEMLSTPRNEFPEFPAALSFIFGLTPEEVLDALEHRAGLLREQIAELDRDLQSDWSPPRLFLLETEYMRAVAAAELAWVTGIVDDLRSGALTWSHEEIAALAAQFEPPD